MSEKRKSFVKGALILSIAGILAKCLGALYRIPFARIATDACGAIYGMVYPVYTLLLALSTAGVPLAISKLVAEYEDQGRSGMSLRVLKVSLAALSAVGIAVACFVFVNADWLAVHMLHEPRTALSLRAIAPAMIFTCMQAVFRGYFQGLQEMVPTALSQITEQFVRVGVILLALLLLMPYGDTVTAAGASAGASVGSGTAFLLILTIFLLYRRRERKADAAALPDPAQRAARDRGEIGNGRLLGKVVALAIPISIGSLVLPIMQSIDSVLVLPRLEAGGFSHAEALVSVNYLTNCVQPIINLPFILTTAISASLVPNIAEAISMGRRDAVKSNFSAAMQLAVLIVLPATVGLMCLATPITELLFARPGAGVAMFWSAAVVLTVGLYQISAGTLQGMGRAMVPMYSLLLGAAVKTILTYLLTAMPTMGVRGAALGSVVGFAVAAANNLYQVSRQIGWDWLSPRYHIVKPLISVGVMAVLVIATYRLLFSALGSNGIATLAAVALGGCAYAVTLLLIGGVRLEIIRKIPKVGDRLAERLSKLRLVRE